MKLTAERTRERIQHLKNWQQQRGLTLREKEYLEAMELALEVLEAQADATMFGTGFVVCTASAEPRRADPTKVRIMFTDSGIGYGPENIKRFSQPATHAYGKEIK